MAPGDLTLCCLVCAAAGIICCIKSNPGTSKDTPISAIVINDRITHVTLQNVIDALQDAVVAIGEHWLGITKKKIGTNLIKLGAAMAMYLGECAIFTIMLISRWSSNAFLRYICKQVMEFSQILARKMLTCREFHHISGIHHRIPRDDPRQRNNPNNAKTRQNIGGNMLCQAYLPVFSLYW